MKKLKANCMSCWYGGSGDIKKCEASCSNDERQDRYTVRDTFFGKDIQVVKTINDNFDIKCDEYVPNVDQDDVKVSTDTTYIIMSVCPHCESDQVLYCDDNEGNTLLKCEECEKCYGVNWSYDY